MSHRVVRRLFAFSLVLFAFAEAIPQASPRKSDDAQEAVIYQRILNRARFENDGTGVEETEAAIRVQSQAGVTRLGQLVFGYSSATEELKVDYVRVRKPDGQIVTTPDSTAQDFAPDLLKEAPMYTDYRQRHISVAALQPGDTLEYRTVTRIVTPLAAGHFWYEHRFPRGVVVNDDRLEIDIPASRDVKLKSPDRPYDTKTQDGRRVYTWVVKDIRPDLDKDADDNDEDDAAGPDVQLTTFADWKQLAQWYAHLQGERMVVDESVRRKADELVKGASNNEQKARRLYDFVARNVRYVSLSFGIGRFQPHAASDVLANGYGDCKDKHTLLSAMLKAEGIPSYPVLIHSQRRLDPDVPSPAQFDHVITAARLAPGAPLTWLDTTTEVAPYGLILYQLRNKQAVLASEDVDGGLQRTPIASPLKSSVRFLIDGKISEFGALDANLEYVAEGDRDFPMRAGFRDVPEARWKDFVRILSSGWGFPGDVDHIQVDPIEDTSHAFRLKYHVHVDQYFPVPSNSASFRPIPAMGVRAVAASSRSKEPIDIGPIGEIVYRIRLEFPANFSLSTPAVVRMSRDYGDYSSSYTLTRGVLEGERKLILKLNELPAARRADYDSFRNVTRTDESQVLTASILAPSGKTAAAAPVDSTPAELHRAGVKALQSRDYRTAADLLQRAVDQDGSIKEGWFDLGQAYAGLNNHAEAARAFRKEVELDSGHKSANGALAMELQQQGKSDDAVAAYRKQLDIVPFDKAAHKNLGMLLAQLGRDADARTELETAASIPPDDPETRLSLAQVYGRLGEKAKAEELLKGLTGSASAESGNDIFAAALAPDIDPTKTENDARQVLYDIGEQFDSGEYDRLTPSAFSAMRLVALAWSRIGWAKFLRGESLEAMQFLNSAWLLSQSGTVANRLGQVYEKQGQRERARQMYAFAVAAGGNAAADSRDRLAKLSVATDKELPADLVQARTVKLAPLAPKASAQFNLVFDGSPRPERAEFIEGDDSLRPAAAQLREKDFPVKFPDASSVKIVRRAKVTCAAAGCAVELLPVDSGPGSPATAIRK